MLSGVRLKEVGRAYSVIGKCFRFESTNLSDLRRLWDFTMREVVFVGTRDYVLRRRDEAIAAFGPMLDRWHLTGEIRTASDPFFIAPDSTAKTCFQLSSGTKYEISLPVGSEENRAVGSFNYHTDFFGKAFDIHAQDGSALQSVCVAFGLARWIYAFMAEHATDPSAWPAEMFRGRQSY